MKVRFWDMPPSTLNASMDAPESASAAANSSAPRWATPSRTALATCALVLPRVRPKRPLRAP